MPASGTLVWKCNWIPSAGWTWITSRLASVRAIELSTAELADRDALFRRTVEGARLAVKEDRAEVIVMTGSVMVGLEEKLSQEVQGSKTELETMTGEAIYYFAYPSGDVNKHVIQSVQDAGYHLAFTTSPKRLQTPNDNPHLAHFE